MNSGERIQRLRERLGEISDVGSALSLLHWDQQTHMPPKGAEGRGRQIATLSAIRHRLFVSREIADLIAPLREELDRLSDGDRKLVEATAYDYDRAVKLPEKFVQDLAQTESEAFEAWVDARRNSDFPAFSPHLEKLVTLQREKADLLGYEGDRYNALLETFERGMTVEKVASVFEVVGQEQGRLVKSICEAEQPHLPWLDQVWPSENQWDFGMKILADIGYDLEAGRQDHSEHPFSTDFDIFDVRITTRVHEDDLFSALMSTLHEAGHALYEQGFLKEDARTPLAEAPSLGIHESQSRLWENMIGRSLPFWEHYLPDLQAAFPGQLDDLSARDVYRAINQVRRSLIRVEADECTYNLHVILRFELERAMLSGDLAVADLPGAWNEKMRQLLGVEVPDDAHGCLQDVHWSSACFGYFPTYALGNLYSAQLFERILEEIPDFWGSISEGDFTVLLGWLRHKVHRIGRRMTTPEIVRTATGADLDSGPYLKYLNSKYKPLYGLS